MTTNKNKFSSIVYSTDFGKMCPSCGQPITDCVCRQNKSTPVGDGIVRVGMERKGRKGKGMTVITGVPLDQLELLALAKKLKIKCGTGGTLKDGVIEIQGNHRDMLVEVLKEQGWTVKRSGG